MGLPEKRAALEAAGYKAWLSFCFPQMFSKPMGAHHERFWEFVWDAQVDSSGSCALALARGGGKSSSSEVAAVALGALRRRKYAWYLSESQAMSDGHLKSIAELLETSRQFALMYPEHANRKMGRYGDSGGWRRNRLYTAGGFLIDAIGYDTGARGAKMMENRPDLLIIDDYDGRHDSARTIKKKIEVLTATILPALNPTPLVLFPQNLIHRNSIMSLLCRGEADFLKGIEVIGPVPALEDLEVQENAEGKFEIIAGRPTWEGQDAEVAQGQINLWGLTAFRLEAQHEVDEMPGAQWSRWGLNNSRVAKAPETLYRIGVGVDPATSGQGDKTGIVGFASGPPPEGATVPQLVDGEMTDVLDKRTHGYVLKDATELAPPSVWRETVARTCHELGATVIVVERNRLGETAKLVIQEAEYWDARGITCPEIVDLDAKLDKKTRAQPVAAAWGTSDEDQTIRSEPRMHIVGKLDGLEDSMATWQPDTKGESPDAIDALVHVATQLMFAEASTRSGGRALGGSKNPSSPSGSSGVRRAGRALGQ